MQKLKFTMDAYGDKLENEHKVVIEDDELEH